MNFETEFLVLMNNSTSFVAHFNMRKKGTLAHFNMIYRIPRQEKNLNSFVIN